MPAHPLPTVDPFQVDVMADTDPNICLDVPAADDGSLAVPIRPPTIDELRPNMVQISLAVHQRLLAIEKSHRVITSTLLSLVACIQTHANSRCLNERLVTDYLGEAVVTLAEARRLYR